MKNKFPGHFPAALNDVEQFWKDCLFVLDTNVLLSLYRYSSSTREEFFRVLASLGERLWIPYQVGREYLDNRLAVIAEQVKVYEDSVKKVEALRSSLEGVTQHPFVSLEALSECQGAFDRLVTEFKVSKSAYEERISNDDILFKISGLLDGKVGDAFDRARLEQVIADGASRYLDKIPPGFSDAKKGGDSPVFDDRCRPYGDYIIWLQVIEKAVAVSKPVVFVTGDSKEDWWVVHHGKTTGPHPKLLREFEELTQNSLYIYTPHQFLQRAGEFLHRETSVQAVKEVRESEQRESVVEHGGGLSNFWVESSYGVSDFFGSDFYPWDFPSKDFDKLISQRETLCAKIAVAQGKIDKNSSRLQFLDEEFRKGISSAAQYARIRRETDDAKRQLSYYQEVKIKGEELLGECDAQMLALL